MQVMMVSEATGQKDVTCPRASGQVLNWSLSDSQTHRSFFHSSRCSPLGAGNKGALSEV